MRKRLMIRAGAVLLALLIAGAALVFYTQPARAAQHYLTATYAGNHLYRDLQVTTLEVGPDRVRLRLSARFATDPDYGAADDRATWQPYTSQVDLVRQGLRWLPAHGGILKNDRTYAVFTWTAADPVVESGRKTKPCT